MPACPYGHQVFGQGIRCSRTVSVTFSEALRAVLTRPEIGEPKENLAER